MKSGVLSTGESQRPVSEEVSDLLFQYQGELNSGMVSSKARRPTRGRGNLKRPMTHPNKALRLPADDGYLSSPAGEVGCAGS